MNILFFADPNSIHDIKWISYFNSNKIANSFLIVRNHHLARPDQLSADHVLSIRDFSIVRFYQTIFTACKIKRIIKVRKIDLIHIQYAEPNALWCLFRSYFNVPMIITCLGSDVLKTIPEFFQKKSLISFFVAPAYKRAFLLADWVTATSKSQLNSIKQFSTRKFNLEIVRTGVDVKRLLADTSNYFPLSHETQYFLFPRYIKPIYNHEFCIEAIALLPAHIKKKYKMIFVGKDSGDATYQKFLEQKMSLVKDVEFIFLSDQSQESIFELYKKASLIIMTPHSDGSPVSAMEAIACGAKVILGPIEYDENLFGQWSFRLTAWNKSELAQLMIDVLSIENGKDLTPFLQLIDQSNEMEKANKIYQSIIGSRV
jgi:glycosyltransferase involved in cell wall biosynthesis